MLYSYCCCCCRWSFERLHWMKLQFECFFLSVVKCTSSLVFIFFFCIWECVCECLYLLDSFAMSSLYASVAVVVAPFSMLISLFKVFMFSNQSLERSQKENILHPVSVWMCVVGLNDLSIDHTARSTGYGKPYWYIKWMSSLRKKQACNDELFENKINCESKLNINVKNVYLNRTDSFSLPFPISIPFSLYCQFIHLVALSVLAINHLNQNEKKKNAHVELSWNFTGSLCLIIFHLLRLVCLPIFIISGWWC